MIVENAVVRSALELYDAPNKHLVEVVPPLTHILIYRGNWAKYRQWTQVEYKGKGAWAILPKHLE